MTESTLALAPTSRRGAPQPRGQRRAAPAPPVGWLHRTRLTGRGTGLLALVLTMLVGAVDQLLPAPSPVRYGLLFVLVCVVCGLWVRPEDLVVAPMVVPIAFAAGLVFLGDPAEMLSALALQAPWLYGGTLVAVLIAAARGRVARRERRRLGPGAR